MSFKNGKIPLFTSIERIYDKGIVKDKAPYLQIKGENIFTVAKGATFILNPFSEYSKELLPNEIEGMLNGLISSPIQESIKVLRKTKITKPIIYPERAVDALKFLYSSHKEVKSAYIGMISISDLDDSPHYIIAIEGQGNLKDLFNDSYELIKKYLSPNELVDFYQISTREGLNNPFPEEYEPFYIN